MALRGDFAAALDTGAQTLVRKRPWRVSGEFTADGGQGIGAVDHRHPAGYLECPGRISLVGQFDFARGVRLRIEVALFGTTAKGMYALPQRLLPHAGRLTHRYTQIAAWGIPATVGSLAALAGDVNALVQLALKRALTRNQCSLRALGFRRTPSGAGYVDRGCRDWPWSAFPYRHPAGWCAGWACHQCDVLPPTGSASASART